jgi:hypothetical protein
MLHETGDLKPRHLILPMRYIFGFSEFLKTKDLNSIYGLFI